MNAALYIQYKEIKTEKFILELYFEILKISNQESLQRFCNGGDFRDLPRVRIAKANASLRQSSIIFM